MTTIERIKESLPHPTIEPIVEKSSYETIKPLPQKINTNAASIVTHLVNGRLDLLYLTVTPAVFTTLCKVLFVRPVNPGPSPVIPPGATQFQIQTDTSLYNQSTKDFKQYNATGRALKTATFGRRR